MSDDPGPVGRRDTTDTTATTAGPAPSGRRPMVGVLVLLAGAAALGLVAVARPWATVRAPSSLTADTVDVSGGDLVPFASPVLLVALAAALVIPVMRTVGRRIVGAVGAVLAVALAVGSGRVAAELPDAAERWMGGTDGLETATSVAWPIGTAGVAVLVAVACVLVVVRAPSWPGLSSRYERPNQTHTSTAADTSSREAWDELDRGEDPTA